MQPLVSVIIPVYKVEQYIRRCIDSVIAQTYKAWELILVDDGSPDNSGAICDEYTAKDSRIKVIHKQNGGVSSARNCGLDATCGEWIAFIDSDDAIHEDYLERYTSAICTNTQLVVGKIETSFYNNYKLPEQEVCRDDKLDYILNNNLLVFSAPFCKLFRRDIIELNKIRYPIGIKNGEDGIFYTKYLSCIDNMYMLDYCGYKYTELTTSLSNNYYSFEDEWKCYLLWKEEIHNLFKNYREDGAEIKDIVWRNRIGDTFYRCLICSYRKKNKDSIRLTIKHLCSIPEEDWNEYSLYYNPKGIYGKLQKSLLCSKSFFIYACLGRIDRVLRKITNMKRYLTNIQKIVCLVLYYTIAYWLPESYSKWGGAIRSKSIRYILCGKIFEYCGENVNIERKASFGSGRYVRIGDNSGLGIRCDVPNNIVIGENVMMGPDVVILQNNHITDRTDIPMCQQGHVKSRIPVIDDDVWVCARVLMTPGRHVSKGSIIAAGCVLSKDFPEYSVVGGNPSRLIKTRKQ